MISILECRNTSIELGKKFRRFGEFEEVCGEVATSLLPTCNTTTGPIVPAKIY
ncbi:MAG TPA: hypothetical protein VMU77_07355 [Acidimicrobiales bacterium]|nr:hypothetical protein [Acidimicrobiales bacterium]